MGLLKPIILRSAAIALLACALAAPVASAEVGPDYVSSDNVTLLGRLKEVGTGVGAVIFGPYMYVTSTHGLFIYDVKSDPANPKLISNAVFDIQFENEEVSTNGKVLEISSDTFCIYPDPTGLSHSAPGGCLALYDVSDPTNVKLITVVDGAGDHTSSCVLDCSWYYGSSGHVTDARDPSKATLTDTNWQDALSDQGWSRQGSCHHQREIQPGIILASCQPVVLLTVRAQDGADPLHPILLAQGGNDDGRFIHSSRWPRAGADKFLLVGGETNASPQCDDSVGAFMVWDGTGAQDGHGGFLKGGTLKEIDELRPTNGTYTDGHSPYNALGCTVHWFEEHPTFHDGGLVALAEYENGTRFLQITPEGKIKEQGYFLPAAGSTSAPHWNPFDPTIVYAIDYARGVDVLKYTGDTYVPGQPTPAGATPGTNGKQPDVGPCAAASGFKSAKVAPKGKKVAFKVSMRTKKPFSVDVLQQSQGSKVIGNRLVARFTGKKKSFTWNGRDHKGRKLSDGNYFVRFSTRTDAGARDQRRATLTRSHGSFRKAPDFYQRIDCGYFASLKLSSSVFGGRTKEPLGVAYRLAAPVKSVTVTFKVGSKVVRTVSGGGEPNRTYRVKVPASITKRGKLVKVIVTPTTDRGTAPSITLAAKHL